MSVSECCLPQKLEARSSATSLQEFSEKRETFEREVQGFQNFKKQKKKVQESPMHAMRRNRKNPPYCVTVYNQKKPLKMELNTGADVSAMSKRQYQEILPFVKLTTPTVMLRTYRGEAVKPQGVAMVSVHHQGFEGTLLLHILRPVMGRDWLSKIKLDWTMRSRSWK